MPDASLLVEFVGLPGAGKSALSHALARRLRAHGVAVDEPSRVLAHDIGRTVRRLRKARIVAGAALAEPVAALRAARIVAAGGQPASAGRASLWGNWLLVTALVRDARRRPGVHLIDEGPAQGAWSVALEGDAGSACALLGTLPPQARPDLLVVVEAPAEVVAARIRARPEADSRFDRRLDAEPGLLALGASALEAVRGALQEVRAGTRAVPVVVIPNAAEEDLEQGAAELAERLYVVARRDGDDTRPGGRAAV